MKNRILVVDDERDAADSLAMLIRANGHEAQAVYNGEQAIKLVANFEPEMILLDIGMPGLNGYETVARIRRERPNSYIILVAVTGWSGDEDKQRAYEYGFDLYITKPMSSEVLNNLLGLLDPKQGIKAWDFFDQRTLRELKALYSATLHDATPNDRSSPHAA